MTAATSDVIVIGGGIMGTAAAFFLQRRGVATVVLERGLVGQQASGVNFGNVRRQGRPLSELAIANRAMETWRRFRELTGEDVEYLQSGHLRVCYQDRPELLGQMEDYARQARPLGLELEILSGTALHARFPFLGPEVLAGSYSASDGHANPRLAAPAFARAAARAGAQILEMTAVQSIDKDGDFHVRTVAGRTLRAPTVLLAAGAWADRFAAQFAEPVPLVVHGPTMSVTEPVTYSIKPAVGVYTPVKLESVYFRQIPRGNIIIGGSTRGVPTRDPPRAMVAPENTLSQLQQLRRLTPALAALNIIRVWSGVEGYLPDDHPVMGASPSVSGLYYAFGFCGSGFQIGPGVGEVMAELIATGTTSVDLSSYRMSRFSGNPS